MAVSLASVAGVVSLAAGAVIWLAGQSFGGLSKSLQGAIDRFQAVLAEVTADHAKQIAEYQKRERETMAEISEADLVNRLGLLPHSTDPDTWVHRQIEAIARIMRCSHEEAVGILLRGMRRPTDGQPANENE